MFGMGMPEILLILAIALIVIGPKKLPELAKSLGRAMNEFKRATSDFKDTLELDHDVKKTFDDIETEIKKPIDVKPVKKSANSSNNKDKISVLNEDSQDECLKDKSKKNEIDDAIPATDIPGELLSDKANEKRDV